MKNQLAKDALGLLAFVALCFGAAWIGWIWTNAGLTDWYATLRKPAWTPPNWIFGPVWSVLYLTMAVAGWLVWRRLAQPGAKVALLLFVMQLGLNAIWTGLFFALRNPGFAFGEILLLWLAIVATLMSFWRVNRVSALLMVPYLAWVTFAARLNMAIWILNR